MVAAQQRDMRRMRRLEQHQQGKHLQAVVAAVHKVAHKNVIGAGHLTAGLKQLEQIVELAVYVSADLQGRGGGGRHWRERGRQCCPA